VLIFLLPVPAYYIVLFVPMYDLFVGIDQPPCILTPWSRVLLEKLTGSRVVKKFPAFTQKIHYLVYNSPPPVPILSHLSISCRAMKWQFSVLALATLLRGCIYLHSVACFRMSGAVRSIADLPSWSAQGQVCRKRDVIPVINLAIIRLFKNNSSYIDNLWSNGKMVSSVWETSLQLHGETEENHEKC
jgi:hypothetical protein